MDVSLVPRKSKMPQRDEDTQVDPHTHHLITKLTSVRPKWAVERDFMLPLVMTLSQTI